MDTRVYIENILLFDGNSGCFSFSISIQTKDYCRKDYDWSGVEPYIVLVGEHDDGPGVGGLQQASDDLVELSSPGLPGDLQGLGDAHPPCRTHGQSERGY